jgi:hypothetical protein
MAYKTKKKQAGKTAQNMEIKPHKTGGKICWPKFNSPSKPLHT